MGTNLSGFPGKEDGMDRGLLTAACGCGSQGEGRTEVSHLTISRYCKVFKDCYSVAIQAREYLKKFLLPLHGYEKTMYNLALCQEYVWSRINCEAPAMF